MSMKKMIVLLHCAKPTSRGIASDLSVCEWKYFHKEQNDIISLSSFDIYVVYILSQQVACFS